MSLVIPQESFKAHSFLLRLNELHDIPKKLHLIGNLPQVTYDEYGRATPRILTIVGSRKNTEYGKSVLQKLMSSLRGCDVVILSGLAYGIDSLAHKEALANNLITIAIPGSGLDKNVLYPHTARLLSDEILDKGGALISELDDHTKPAPWTFPQRNRLMAALSDAVLIIEAEEKSGTLITARQALELGRDIGAVPGDVFSPTTAGPHTLIKDGAYPITNGDDLLALLHITKKDSEETIKLDLTNEEKIIIDLVREPIEKDELFIKSELSFEEFLSAFSSLEIKGYLQETFGEVRKVV